VTGHRGSGPTKIRAELEAKTKEFQAAVAATGIKLGGNVAKMEVRDAESAFA
jgi:hypothetical protein